MSDFLEDELRRLPTPRPPAALVERVRRVAHLELASRADEKLNRLVLVFLLVFSWTLALVGFLAVRVVAAGTVSVLGLAALQGSTLTSFNWSLVYFAAAWISGAILFVVLGLHARKQRRIAWVAPQAHQN
jgi:hypothetical protein